MDALLQAFITAAPNMILAVWVLWRDDRRISTLLEIQRWLIEQLMALHPPQDEESSKKETD